MTLHWACATCPATGTDDQPRKSDSGPDAKHAKTCGPVLTSTDATVLGRLVARVKGAAA